MYLYVAFDDVERGHGGVGEPARGGPAEGAGGVVCRREQLDHPERRLARRPATTAGAPRRRRRPRRRGSSGAASCAAPSLSPRRWPLWFRGGWMTLIAASSRAGRLCVVDTLWCSFVPLVVWSFAARARPFLYGRNWRKSDCLVGSSAAGSRARAGAVCLRAWRGLTAWCLWEQGDRRELVVTCQPACSQVMSSPLVWDLGLPS